MIHDSVTEKFIHQTGSHHHETHEELGPPPSFDAHSIVDSFQEENLTPDPVDYNDDRHSNSRRRTRSSKWIFYFFFFIIRRSRTRMVTKLGFTQIRRLCDSPKVLAKQNGKDRDFWGIANQVWSHNSQTSWCS